MREQRKCKTCSAKFCAIKETQRFCSRKCFKRDYYIRTREGLAILGKQYPTYTCGLCGQGTPLDYDPVKKWKLFGGLICPFCGVPKNIVIKYQEERTFVLGNSRTVQYVVSSAIVSTA